MKKKVLITLSLILVLVLGVFCLSGCSKEMGFLDFSKYSDFDENVTEIKVSWDINDNSAFEFTITDGQKIDEIVSELVDNTRFVLAEKSDGNHSNIIFVCEGGKETKLSLAGITDGNKYYKYKDTKFFGMIEEIFINESSKV